MIEQSILDNRRHWEVAVVAVRKHERGEAITPSELLSLDSIDLEVSCAIFPESADWLRSLRVTR